MQKDLDYNAEESNESTNDNAYVPFDGFVNVNEIIKRRREQKTELMNGLNEEADRSADKEE